VASPIIIRYAARLDATPESELEALVACYSFLIERAESRKAAGPKSGGEEKGGDNDRESGAHVGWQGRLARSVSETSSDDAKTNRKEKSWKKT
jgi:hypothetical protein